VPRDLFDRCLCVKGRVWGTARASKARSEQVRMAKCTNLPSTDIVAESSRYVKENGF
jgi:hypothetical protein